MILVLRNFPSQTCSKTSTCECTKVSWLWQLIWGRARNGKMEAGVCRKHQGGSLYSEFPVSTSLTFHVFSSVSLQLHIQIINFSPKLKLPKFLDTFWDFPCPVLEPLERSNFFAVVYPFLVNRTHCQLRAGYWRTIYINEYYKRSLNQYRHHH